MHDLPSYPFIHENTESPKDLKNIDYTQLISVGLENRTQVYEPKFDPEYFENLYNNDILPPIISGYNSTHLKLSFVPEPVYQSNRIRYFTLTWNARRIQNTIQSLWERNVSLFFIFSSFFFLI